MMLIKRLGAVAVTTAVAGLLFVPAASATELTYTPPPNGGDNGYGNCGFNNSGKPGEKVTGPTSRNEPGLGGFVQRGVKPSDAICNPQLQSQEEKSVGVPDDEPDYAH
jgi:hypothetical protein